MIAVAERRLRALRLAVRGALADTRPKPRLLLIGSLILAVSFLTFYVSPLFWLNLVIMFLIGDRHGQLTKGSPTPCCSTCTRTRAPYYININHFFVTFGSALIAIYLIFLQMNWRVSVVQSGVAVLCLAVFFAFVSTAAKQVEAAKLPGANASARQQPACCAAVRGDDPGGGHRAGDGWRSEHLPGRPARLLRDGVQDGPGRVPGRAWRSDGWSSGRCRAWNGFHAPSSLLFGLAAVLLAVLFFVPLGVLTYVVVFLAGFAMSALLPLMLSFAGSRFREMSGTVMGTVKVAIPIGGALLPFVMSLATRSLVVSGCAADLPARHAGRFPAAARRHSPQANLTGNGPTCYDIIRS